jgi:hypothetical protein
MNPLEKRFLTSFLVVASGVNAATFHDWRGRLGLFPWSRNPGEKGGEGWNTFSILDVCIVRLIVVLTSNGISARDAVLYSQHECALIFKSHLTRSAASLSSIVGFTRDKGRPDDTVGTVIDREFKIKRQDEIPASPSDLRLVMCGNGSESLLNLITSFPDGIYVLNLCSIIDHVIQQARVLQPEIFISQRATDVNFGTTDAAENSPANGDRPPKKRPSSKRPK